MPSKRCLGPRAGHLNPGAGQFERRANAICTERRAEQVLGGAGDRTTKWVWPSLPTKSTGAVGVLAQLPGVLAILNAVPREFAPPASRGPTFSLITVLSFTKSGGRSAAALHYSPHHADAHPKSGAYRIWLRDTQRTTIGSDRILESHVDRKRGTSRFSVTPNSRQARPTDRAIANAQLMLGLIGLPFTLGSRPASSPYGTFRRGSFANFIAARTEILRVRYWCRGRHGRRLTQRISAAPHGLDVVTAASCSGNFFCGECKPKYQRFLVGVRLFLRKGG